VRFLPSIAGYVYAVRGDQLYVNLFLGGSGKAQVAGTAVTLQQQSDYPWDGRITLRVQPEKPVAFTLNVRIPGWARNQPVPSDLYRYDDGLNPQPTLAVNGQASALNMQRGFARVQRQWQSGDVLTLELPMPVRRVAAHPAVKADRDRFAVERGPIVFCAEGADNGGRVLDKVPGSDVRFKTIRRPNLLGGLATVEIVPTGPGDALTCIPYYAWCHRGSNEMEVWFPVKPIERLASHCWDADSIEACFDPQEPKKSGDLRTPRFTWWDHKGTTEWVEMRFDAARSVAAARVFWFDDTGRGSCRVPQGWRLLYKEGDAWKPVAAATAYGTELDRYNRVTFAPVTTTALRIEARLQPKFSAGILRWRVE
jgi:hypothetical protein